jgi:hypothetical protein
MKHVKICVLFVFAAVAMTDTAIALPRRPGSGCTCACEFYLNGTLISTLQTYSAPNGTFCSAYNNKTCNLEDPVSGGLRSGNTVSCGQESLPTTFVWSQFGGLTIYRGGVTAPH